MRVNAKVDYTLLDRWRHGHAWRSASRPVGSSAAAVRPESHRDESLLQDEPDGGSRRVVHMPLAD